MPNQPHAFFCVDGHTCGNPVRLVSKGAPELNGANMSEKRQDFLTRFDWMRTSLMFEPRGHDMMSGAFLYPPVTEGADASILFIETSGCLPMCGHGAIGALTMAIEGELITPSSDREVIIDVPAGTIKAEYLRRGKYVEEVRLYNVPSYLAASDIVIDCPSLGSLNVDVSYGGNFYAIIDPQPNFSGLEDMSADEIVRLSPIVRDLVREKFKPVHPEDDTIKGVSHVMWTGAPQTKRAHARNAVFYGDKAIDRSPCGTGTSARMAQWAARGRLKPGDEFIHESIIGSMFDGRVEEAAQVGEFDAIRPSFAGWARMTGLNTIFVDERDPFWRGFTVK